MKDTYNKTSQHKTHCPSQSSVNNGNCYNYKKLKVETMMYQPFWSLEGVIIMRRMGKKG